MRAAVTAWVALGANLGDAQSQIQAAADTLRQQCAAGAWVMSRLYRSAPHEAQGPDYFNAVVRFDTCLTAPALLDVMQAIELAAGRQRPYHHAPRTLDLDLLFYGSASMSSPKLSLPHPRWSERAFVLYPLADVSPEHVSTDLWNAVAGQPISVVN